MEIFFNGGEFYGTPDPYLNLKLINRFFTKYPEYADQVVLCVKGGLDAAFHPDGSPENVRKSVMNIINHLGDKKSLDLFECARVDDRVPIETTVGCLGELVKEGLIKGISLSEVGVETIRRAAKVHKISAVEIEYSLFALEARDLGVLSTCAELGIPVVAYSPLCRGFLTGQIKSRNDLDEGDFRLAFPRFSEENFSSNLTLADKIAAIAHKNKVTPAQIALSWIKKHEEIIPGLTIIPIPGATTVERVEENFAEIRPMTDEEFNDIGEILSRFEIQGARYPGDHGQKYLWA